MSSNDAGKTDSWSMLRVARRSIARSRSVPSTENVTIPSRVVKSCTKPAALNPSLLCPRAHLDRGAHEVAQLLQRAGSHRAAGANDRHGVTELFDLGKDMAAASAIGRSPVPNPC